jgi:hypothetical protein
MIIAVRFDMEARRALSNPASQMQFNILPENELLPGLFFRVSPQQVNRFFVIFRCNGNLE